MARTVKTLQVEKKTLTIERNENQAGEFVRITEETQGRSHRNAIVIPLSGVKDVVATLNEVAHVDRV